ncbi:MAG: hypothetical protein QGF09_13855 [Rhodospirillales bacterium]|nr:hypothetical protein [Rhodospirillales bacterium]
MTGTGLAKPRLNFSRARKILVALAIPALIWPQAAPTAAVGTEPEPVAQGTARRVGDGDTLVAHG